MAELDESAIFNAARKIDAPDEREAYLKRACGEDQEAYERVAELLRAYEAERSFLESPPAELDPPTDFAPISEGPGTVIGPYKLREQIGEGGFGLVFVAEQTEPIRRKVALKIIKPGMDTRQVIARFEAERQALALMDHPNIAKVLDAGTTAGESRVKSQEPSAETGTSLALDSRLSALDYSAGRPYFVMELVKGVPLTEYCDQQHLRPRERLELFVTLCHAIQHAHQKGIIHRDVKPTNVLVTLHDGRPVVKVIDFGVAKALSQQLTQRTIYTQFAQLIGTPLYMSPEQAEMSGLDIDTRSDIYSLGVLLYELLTGTTPFEGERLKQAALDEIRRILREEEPPKPSTRISQSGDRLASIAAVRGTEPAKLSKQVRGELDWIVMKCLEKDRSRRYETANALAMEVERHLHDEPVLARPPSTAYKLQKAWRRNKLAFMAAGGVAAALVLAVVMSIWIAAEQIHLRKEAEVLQKIADAELAMNHGDFETAASIFREIDDKYKSYIPPGRIRRLANNAAYYTRWRDAADYWALVLQINSGSYYDRIEIDHLRYATALVRLGDFHAYEAFRQATAARYAATGNPITAEHLVRICLLMPADKKLLAAIGPMHDLMERGQDDPNLADHLPWQQTQMHIDSYRAWGCNALALFDYRRGNWEQSIGWCKKALDDYPLKDTKREREAAVRAILAANYHQRGDPDEARNELETANQMISQYFEEGPKDEGAYDWLIAKFLADEAARLIEGRPPE